MKITFNENGQELETIIKKYLILYYEKIKQKENKKEEYE